MHIFVVNCGSSSMKFALLEFQATTTASTLRRLAVGRIGGIGGHAALRLSSGDGKTTHESADVPDHAAAMHRALDWLSQLPGTSTVDGIGHRIVHGGPRLFEPTIVDDAVIDQITAAAELAPLHNDAALAAIGAARGRIGETVPMVAVFDTAFHRRMPKRAALYAIPPDVAEEHGIRRYGFHGLAHRWMAERCAQLLKTPLATLKLITLQLGGGCSAAAIAGGRSIDTSMGFTPLEGLMMGTRSGDLDPAVMRFLCDRTGKPLEEVEQWLNHEAGLAGVSGHSADVRELLARERQGDARAALALEMFSYRVRKYIGAYLAALDGADAVVFGGGIGENAAEIRERIGRDMAWCGLRIDARRNRDAVEGDGEISADLSTIRAFVIPVDEETLIGRDTYHCLSSRRSDRRKDHA